MKNYSLKDAFKALDEIDDSVVHFSSVRESFIKEENGEKTKTITFILKDGFDVDTSNRIDDIADEFECRSYMPELEIMEITGFEDLVEKCKEKILAELADKVTLNEGCSKKLKEGYLGQTLRDFLDTCIDASTIDEIVLSDIDFDDFTVVFRGKFDDIPDEMLDSEYADFDCGGDKVTVNVGEDGYDDYYDNLESFLEDYNGDEVEIAEEVYGGFDSVFTGDKSDAIDEYGDMAYQSFDAPKYICINIHGGKQFEPLKESKQEKKLTEDLKESKSFSLTDDTEVKEAKEFLDNDKAGEKEEVIVNIDADTVDQLAKDNVGSFVFTCTNCGCEVLRTLDQLKDIGYERQEDGTFKLKDPDDNAEFISCPECHNSETFNGNKRIEAADVEAEVKGEEPVEPANTETNAEAGVVPEETEVKEEETFGESLEEGKEPRKAGDYIFYGEDEDGKVLETVEFKFDTGKIRDLKQARNKLFDNEKVTTVYVAIKDEKGQEKPLDIYTIDRDELNESLKEDKEEPKLETFDEQMDFLAKDEEEAIEGYDKIIALVEDEHVKEQLKHIKKEEVAHKEFLEAVKKDPTLTYEHDDEKEEVVNVEETNVIEESLKEGFKKKENGKFLWSKDGEDWEECTGEEFDECGYKDVTEDEFDEFTVTDIEEESLDKAICEHLEKMFENFGSYKTETAILRDVENKIILEGVLTFKNNKVQDTRLVLEAIDYDSNSGSLKFSLTSPDFENMSGNLNTVLKEGLVTSTTFDNINEVLEESKEIEKVIRFFNNENEEEWIDIRMFGDDWEVADVSHGEIIGKDHTKVEDTEYIVHLSEDNDGQFLKLYSLDKETGEEQKGFGFVFESKQSCNEGPLEEGSKNKHKFEVLWYEGPTEEEAMKGDYHTKEFDTAKEAEDFYDSIKDDEDKFGFWVTERDDNWDVIDVLIG